MFPLTRAASRHLPTAPLAGNVAAVTHLPLQITRSIGSVRTLSEATLRGFDARTTRPFHDALKRWPALEPLLALPRPHSPQKVAAAERFQAEALSLNAHWARDADVVRQLDIEETSAVAAAILQRAQQLVIDPEDDPVRGLLLNLMTEAGGCGLDRPRLQAWSRAVVDAGLADPSLDAMASHELTGFLSARAHGMLDLARSQGLAQKASRSQLSVSLVDLGPCSAMGGADPKDASQFRVELPGCWASGPNASEGGLLRLGRRISMALVLHELMHFIQFDFMTQPQQLSRQQHALASAWKVSDGLCQSLGQRPTGSRDPRLDQALLLHEKPAWYLQACTMARLIGRCNDPQDRALMTRFLEDTFSRWGGAAGQNGPRQAAVVEEADGSLAVDVRQRVGEFIAGHG